jgi:hypothetical protein
LYALTTSFISAGDTTKPAEVAQTLSPSLLKMAALSMLPVATRLTEVLAEVIKSWRTVISAR